MATFGTYLANARKQAGLSQKDLAAQLMKEDGTAISPQYLNDLERDRRNPPNEYILRQISQVLNLPLDYLQYVAGRLPSDLQDIRDSQKVEAALKAFRKTIKGE